MHLSFRRIATITRSAPSIIHTDMMARQQHSPYTGRYNKKSMSPQPRNPFQGRRSLSGRTLLPRYAPFPHKESPLAKKLKQACIILVAGTILVSLLSVAIPPAPTSVQSRMAAPRPQLSSSGGALRNSVRQRGGVQSQSIVRTNAKPKDNPISDKKHHWGADTLEHSGADSMEEGSSSEESPSKQEAIQKLAKRIAKKTKKQNAAADGVFGRTNEEAGGDDKNGNNKDNVVAAKTASKGKVIVDAPESSEGEKETETEESESKEDVKANVIKVKDEEGVSGESDTVDKTNNNGNTKDTEKELAMGSGKLSEMNLKDEAEEDTSPSDEIEEKQEAFGKDGVQDDGKEEVDKAAADDNKALDVGAGAKKGTDDVSEKVAEADKADAPGHVGEEKENAKEEQPSKVADGEVNEEAKQNVEEPSDRKPDDAKDSQTNDGVVDKSDESVGLNEAKGDSANANSGEAKTVPVDKIADESLKGSAKEMLDSKANSERERVVVENPVNKT